MFLEAVRIAGGVVFEFDPMNSGTPLERGLTVIQAFLDRETRLTVAELSFRTGFSRPSVSRCLYTLEKLGFVVNYGNRYFSLTPNVLLLGYRYFSKQPLAISSHPILKTMSSYLNETCSLSVLEGDEVRCISQACCKRLVQTEAVYSRKIPAYCTSAGRVLLSVKENHDFEAYLARVNILPFTLFTKVHTAELISELETVRHKKYSIVDQEYELGLRSIAVPVNSKDGKTTAALNVSVDAGRINLSEMKSKFLPILYDAAYEIGLLF